MTDKYYPPKIVAEIGANHMGDLELAKKLITEAAQSGAHIAKFQKRCIKELISQGDYSLPRSCPHNSFGKTQGEHREYLEFNQKQHSELQSHCHQHGIEYSSSVWDTQSAREICELNPSSIKVPSAVNNQTEILRILRDHYSGVVHLSLGMTTLEEEQQIFIFFDETEQAQKRLIFYACTSSYPTKNSDASLLEIKRLISTYNNRLLSIGFSGHHLGTTLDISAYTLGATWIERHFTSNKNLKGSDQSLSLIPDELKQLSSDLNATFDALTYKKNPILTSELTHRERLNKQTYLSKTKPLPKILFSDIDGTLTNGGMYYSEKGDELKKFCTSDGIAIENLRKNNILVGFITGETCKLNHRRSKKLSIDYYFPGITDKVTTIQTLLERINIPWNEVAYIGDDLNDFDLLSKVGFAGCPANATNKIKTISDIYQCKKEGGSGAVREFSDWILNN